MKKPLLLLTISLFALAGCETYCERNYPCQNIPVDPLPEPSISEVGYPDGPEEMLEVFRCMRLPEDHEDHMSDQRAMAAILADYAEPLRVLVEMHKERFRDLLEQVDG